MGICDNYRLLINDIKSLVADSGRNISDVSVLAVSKTHTVDKLIEAAKCGIRMFGESRVQEAIPKIEIVKIQYPDAEFHFIGRLQTNKAKKLVEYFSLIHSVDRDEAVEAVNSAAYSLGKVQDILIQLNLAKESQKNGVFPENIHKLVALTSTLSNVRLRGFMFIPPFNITTEQTKQYFITAKTIFEEYKNFENLNLDILSMGMSGDYGLAIHSGSTLIRIGTMLFGER